MQAPSLTTDQRQLIQGQVDRFLRRNPNYQHLPAAMQADMVRDTTRVLEAMAEAGPARGHDPYLALALDTATTPRRGRRPEQQIGDVIGAGVTQAARMVNEIDFPQFVASLIEGTFHAIVKSSIEQMKAYAEMVKSVSTSLNEFKDRNTTDNEARDHLVARYPRHLQITVVNNAPQITPRPDADLDTLPDFAKDFGLDEEITDLDEETLEEKLVPAARDDLARGRQQLLATIILMGINRIVVTDGKINAKLKFNFSANEKRTMSAQDYDYENLGQTTITTDMRDESGASSRSGWWMRTTGENYISSQTSTRTTTPDIRVTSDVKTNTDAELQASGQIMGEVSINFRSETFPLEKMVDTDQMMRLQQAQSSGRGAPPPPAPGATPARPTKAAPASAPTPPA